MSFASDTKKELCRCPNAQPCCQKAEVYGFFLFGKMFSAREISVTTESIPAARRASRQLAELSGSITELTAGMYRQGADRSWVTVSVNAWEERLRVLEFFGHTPQEANLRIRKENLPQDCCYPAFLRGAFLSCGTVVRPEKEYRLEFAVPHQHLARDLQELLQGIGLELEPGVSSRRGTFVVYVNEAEKVGDLLAYMGASGASLELIQAKMLKEVRNNVNRKLNFESANQDKTADAAARQMLAIRRIGETVGFSSLPEPLRQLAQLRYEHPEYSLRELGQSLEPPISRSGVNHRLKRILELAEKSGQTEETLQEEP